MTKQPPAADPPQSETVSQASGAAPSKPSSSAPTVEVRVLLSADVVRRMDISRALVGQTRHAFISLAVERHLEHYGHMVLDRAPEGKSGVAVTLASKDEPRHALPRRGRGESTDGSAVPCPMAPRIPLRRPRPGGPPPAERAGRADRDVSDPVASRVPPVFRRWGLRYVPGGRRCGSSVSSTWSR